MNNNGFKGFDREVVKKQLKAINRELNPITNYIDPNAKQQVTGCVDRITKEVKKTDIIKSYLEISEGFKSALMSLSGDISSKSYRKFLFNRIHSYFYIVNWYLAKDEGIDVGGEPWKVSKEFKEREEPPEEEEETKGNKFPGDMFTDGPL